MKKAVAAALVVGILLGWATEYAFLRYQAHIAEQQILAVLKSLKVGGLPTP